MDKYFFKFYLDHPRSATSLVAGIRQLEVLADREFEFTISALGELVPINDLDDFLAIHSDTNLIPILTDGNAESTFTLSGHFLSADFGYANTPLWYMLVTIVGKPEDYLKWVFELGNAWQAIWGVAGSQAVEIVAAQQGQASISEPPYGLPKLNSPQTFRNAAVPNNFSWINYWSKAVWKNFTQKDRQWIASNCTSLANSKGTAFATVEEPLSLEDGLHLSKLNQLYTKFKKVGGRK